jgi:hypothetical protein
MANGAEPTCPHCGYPVGAGDKFCSHCTKQLPVRPVTEALSSSENATEESAPEASPIRPPTVDHGITHRGTDDEPAPLDPSPPPASSGGAGYSPGSLDSEPTRFPVQEDWVYTVPGGRVPPLVQAPNMDTGPQSSAGEGPVAAEWCGDGDCQDIAVEVDCLRPLIEGAHIVLRVRLKALRGNVRRVVLQVVGTWDDENEFRRRERVLRLGVGQERIVKIDCLVPKGVHGIMAFRWEVTHDGCSYEGRQELVVHPRDASAMSVAQQVTVNIKEINQGPAGDIVIKEILGEAKQKTLSEWYDSISIRGPQWQRLELWMLETDGPPALGTPPPAACVVRLTLRLASGRLQLVCRDAVRLGKDFPNELVMHVFDAQGQVLRDPSLRISRTHLTIRRTGGTAWCEDQSLNGSQLGGKLLHSSSAVVEPGGERRLDLAVNGASTSLSLGLRLVHCGLRDPAWGFCPEGPCERRECSALFIGRGDDMPEEYAIVWCHLALRNCRSHLPDVRIWRMHGAFAWSSESGAGWLVPGTEVSLPGCPECRVESFNQFGL